jgi:hypothetical protein
MLLLRIVHFVIGAVFAGGGGFLVWTQRDAARAIFPPGVDGLPWLFMLGLLLALAGVVFLVSAVAPRPNRAARLAAEAERKQETIRAADAYYSERARAADRDWRSGDIPSSAPQAAAAETASVAEPRPAPTPSPAVPVKPVAASAQPETPAPNPFPSTATLAPIPKAAEAPPAAVDQPAPANVVSIEGDAFATIRAAIAEGRLEEAGKLLTAEKDAAKGLALAELTALAGDRAAAAGRQSEAKWLWRLARTRFKEADAMDSPAAQAVSERLRLADN